MPTLVHEVLVELFTETPALTDLLRATDRRVPRLSPTHPNLSEVKPVELRADGLFLAGRSERPRGWVLLEVQTSIDRDKLDTIPLDLEMTRRRYPRTPGDVVLVTASESVARFFDAHPFESRAPLGTRRTLEVVRVDLSRMPARRLLDRRHPYLALLAVAGRCQGTEARPVARRAMALAVTERDPLRARLVDAIFALVGKVARRELKQEMERHGDRSVLLGLLQF